MSASRPEAPFGGPGGNAARSAHDMEEEGGAGSLVLNPLFPEMPASVPLTYTLVMHACLRAGPEDRPTFEQVRQQPLRVT